MGLHIHTLSKVPAHLQKDLYLYLLEYGPADPFSEALRACFDQLADWASRSEAVAIRGTDPVHFADEVFSWHGVAGFDGEEMLPAIMVTTINPNTFRGFSGVGAKYRPSETLILVPLRQYATTADQVYPVVKKLLKQLSQGTKLTDLEVISPKKTGVIEKLWEAVVLRPSAGGVGIDLKKLFGKGAKKSARD